MSDKVGKCWIPAQFDDEDRELLRAASDLIDSNSNSGCPLCGNGRLRFYYHEFGIVDLPRRRGTVWVWCSACRHWEHISGVQLPECYQYDDPLNNAALRRIDGPNLIEHLTKMWDSGRLPEEFVDG